MEEIFFLIFFILFFSVFLYPIDYDWAEVLLLNVLEINLLTYVF